MKTQEADVLHFDLSNGTVPNADRKFCILAINGEVLFKYFKPDIYDIKTGKGEQRGVTSQANKLKKEMQADNYSPAAMNATLLEEHIGPIKDGKVTINFTDKPIPLTDGYQRFEALRMIGEESPISKRKINNIMIPVILSLEPDRRKIDFINYNMGLPVAKSHLMQLNIDTGRVHQADHPYFISARKIAIALHEDVDSPFLGLVQFDQTSSAPISASVIMTNRKTDQLFSLFGSARVMQIFNKDEKWFHGIFNYVHCTLEDNTDVFDEGKLLCLPPVGSKASAPFLTGIVNIFAYNLYLRQREKPSSFDDNILLKAIEVFNDNVNGDVSNRRRGQLIHDFAEKMFADLDSDESIVGFHCGIPIPLVAMFSPRSFGVDSPGKPVKIKSNPKVQAADSVVMASDTDPFFEES